MKEENSKVEVYFDKPKRNQVAWLRMEKIINTDYIQQTCKRYAKLFKVTKSMS